MRFYELKKGQAFVFVGNEELDVHWICAGHVGIIGQFVFQDEDHTDVDKWMYCNTQEEVVLIAGGEE